MNVQEYHTFDLYYNEEGDFLEITFGLPPENGVTNEIEEGVFITKNEKTNELYGIGILSFKKRVSTLGRILKRFDIDLPLKISV